jgi:hypothetical protein
MFVNELKVEVVDNNVRLTARGHGESAEFYLTLERIGSASWTGGYRERW